MLIGLEQERKDLQGKLDDINREIAAMSGVTLSAGSTTGGAASSRKRNISPETREAMRKKMRDRWAERKKAAGQVVVTDTQAPSSEPQAATEAASTEAPAEQPTASDSAKPRLRKDKKKH